MDDVVSNRRAGTLMTVAVALFLTSGALAREITPALDHDGLRIQIDNDLFAGREEDRDYTGGLAVTLSGNRARDHLLSLAPALTALNRAAGVHSEAASAGHALQFGMIAFTPTEISARQPIHADRPYASLLYAANGQLQVSEDGRSAWYSSLAVGALGLSLTKDLHNAIHDAVGSPEARGYAHQISAGGEPTARYTVARQYLWIANPSGTLDVKTTVQGSVGFLTEASAALSLRLGRFDTPWWSAAPELTDYMAAPVPSGRRHARGETYVHAGVRLKARGYNVFLQGQFRDSEVRAASADVERVVVEAWFGMVNEIAERAQLSYVVNYQTAELRHGPAARDTLWGSLQLTFGF